ncbi:MAG: SRPBCC family protein [Saprospiraceae bacterium]
MKILKFLLYLILGLGLLWVALGVFGKKDYHIERSLEIDAPKDVVYEQVRLFKNFSSWSPWAPLDPKMKTSIEGTDGTVGAVYKWSGNDDVGTGQETITALAPDRIDFEVKFIEPFESTSPSYLLFAENGKKTKVTWAFDMHIAFPWNGLAMFTDMDAGVGKDYEKGLENLKKVCEAIAHKKYRGYEVAVEDIPQRFYVGVRKTVPFQDMQTFFETTFGNAMASVEKNGATLSGAPAGLFWSYNEQAGSADMAAAMPVAADGKFGGGMSVFPIGGSQALVISYYGSYEKTGEAHYAMDEYMAEKNLQSIPPVIEEYITDPGKEPDTSKWLTRVVYFTEPKQKQQ